MSRRALALALIAALAVLAVPRAASAATYYVNVRGLSFGTYNAMGTLVDSPAGDPVVDPGDTILWEWGNSGSHDVVSGNLNNGTPDGKFNSGYPHSNGYVYTYTTPLANATYTYFCTPHRVSGMKGSIKATGTANNPPVAALTMSPSQPRPGDTVTFNASTSSDPDANLIASKYRWDLDGDGSFETSTTTPTTSKVFAAAGNFTVRVRVFDAKSALDDEASSFAVAFPAPAAATGAATGVSGTGATLAGSVDPKGSATSYHFEYGATTAYGRSTADQAAGSGTGSQQPTAAVTGLTPATTYHYRIVATSAGGTTAGEDMTFTTTAAPTGGDPLATGAVGRAPALTLGSGRSQRVLRQGLKLLVTVDEPASVHATAEVGIKRLGKTFRFRAVRIRAAAGGRKTVVLRLPSRAAAAVRRALLRGDRLVAAVRVSAADADGNAASASRSVRITG